MLPIAASLLVAGSVPLLSQKDSQPSVEQIFDQYIEALGGKSALSKVETLRMSGSYSFNGMTYPMVLTRQRPDRYRFELDIDGSPYIEATDGTNTWSYMSQRDQPLEQMEGEDATRFQEEWADFDGPLVDYKEKGNTVALVGTENIDGVDCFHLQITFPSGHTQDWFLDVQTFDLVRKVTTQAHRRRGSYDRVWYYEGFRREDGVQMPQYFEREDLQHVRAYDFDTFKINVDVTKDHFSPPSSDRVFGE